MARYKLARVAATAGGLGRMTSTLGKPTWKTGSPGVPSLRLADGLSDRAGASVSQAEVAALSRTRRRQSTTPIRSLVALEVVHVKLEDVLACCDARSELADPPSHATTT